MNEDVPYCYQTVFRTWDKPMLLQLIHAYEKQFGMSAAEYYELFLEGKIKGEDGQRFMFLYEYLVTNYK